MGVIACARCGRDVADGASGCPHCGADPRTGVVDTALDDRLAGRAQGLNEATHERTGVAMFKDAPGLALALFGAALGPILLVGGIGAAVVAVVTQLQIDAFLTPEIGTVAGDVRISVLTVIVTVVAQAWVGATVIALVVALVRQDRRPSVRDLGAGLPFVLWCALGSALEWLATSAATWFLGPVITFLLLFVLLLFIFYQQVIVDQRSDTFSALGWSFRLVCERYWPVLVYGMLGGLMYVAVAVVGMGVGALIGDSLAGRELVTGIVGTPFLLVYVSVLYFLAIGQRPLLEARTGPKPAAAGDASAAAETAAPAGLADDQT